MSGPRSGGTWSRFTKLSGEPASFRSVSSATDFHIEQDAKRVGHKDRDRIVGAHQIGDDGLLVDPHKPDGQTRLVFIWNAGLMQASDALVFLARAEGKVSSLVV